MSDDRGSDDDPFKGRHGCPIPEAISARPVEFGPTIAIVALEMRFGEVPSRLDRDMGPEPVELLGNRLGGLLTRGRDTGIESDCHMVLPEALWTQASCLRQRHVLIAEGAGTYNPTVAHRYSGL